MPSPTRIEPVAEPLPPPIAARMARIFPPGRPAPQLYRTLARNEGLFTAIVDRGLIGRTGLLDRNSLPSPLRETIILRTCVATRNEYEFDLHEQTISARMGLTAGQISDIRNPEPAPVLWPADYLAVIRLVDELVERMVVTDAVYAQARASFDEPTLIEITQIIGLYTGVAMLVALARPQFDHYRPEPRTTGGEG